MLGGAASAETSILCAILLIPGLPAPTAADKSCCLSPRQPISRRSTPACTPAAQPAADASGPYALHTHAQPGTDSATRDVTDGTARHAEAAAETETASAVTAADVTAVTAKAPSWHPSPTAGGGVQWDLGGHPPPRASDGGAQRAVAAVTALEGRASFGMAERMGGAGVAVAVAAAREETLTLALTEP